MDVQFLRWLLIPCIFAGPVWMQDHSEDTCREVFNKTYCTSQKDWIICDYKNSPKSVYWPSECASATSVTIRNLRQLVLKQPVNVDSITVENIEKVYIEKSIEDHDRHVEFKARNVALNQIPSNFKKLYVNKCKIENLSTYSWLSELTVISSEINFLNVSILNQRGSNVMFENSTIEVLQAFVISEKSNVELLNSTILNSRIDGFQLLGGKLSLEYTEFNDDLSLFVTNRSTLVLKNSRGINVILDPHTCDQISDENEKTRENLCNTCTGLCVFLTVAITIIIEIIPLFIIIRFIPEWLTSLYSRCQKFVNWLFDECLGFDNGSSTPRSEDDVSRQQIDELEGQRRSASIAQDENRHLLSTEESESEYTGTSQNVENGNSQADLSLLSTEESQSEYTGTSQYVENGNSLTNLSHNGEQTMSITDEENRRLKPDETHIEEQTVTIADEENRLLKPGETHSEEQAVTIADEENRRLKPDETHIEEQTVTIADEENRSLKLDETHIEEQAVTIADEENRSLKLDETHIEEQAVTIATRRTAFRARRNS